MMNILTKDKWSRFKQDGKLFEELIHDLLCAMYPNADFTHTSWTHDGGKDFECGFPFLNDEIKVWAECKYHKDALPIHEVSMTLCMAYIESAFSILFFSYSAVNSEFQKYIDLYKKKSDKVIEIYADSSLETLILKHRNDFDFESYFGTIETFVPIETYKVNYKFWLHMPTAPKGGSITLYLNDIITLEFSAMNLYSEPITFEFHMNYPKGENCFQILDKQFMKQNLKCSLTIPPHGICGKTIQLKVERYQPILKLPYIKIFCGGETKTLRINKHLECRWLAETPIIGEKYEHILDNWKNSLNGLHNCFGMIAGHSGTGKSRLIQEIGLIATYEGYKVLIFDADKTNSLTALYFFRKLVSEIEDIPYTFKMSHKNTKYIYECLKEKASEYNFIFKILTDDNLEFGKIKSSLISYLILVLNSKNYLLVLDNIQFYDEIILEILQCVMESPELKSNSKLLFATNLDYTYKDTKADQIVKRLEWRSYHSPKMYLYDEVKGFTKIEAQKYLNNCLCYNSGKMDYDNINYDLAITQIIDTYGTNPLFLQNYMLYLLQKGIIARTNTSAFYIVDCAEFNLSIHEIPTELLDLLSYREKELLVHIANYDVSNSKKVQKKYELLVSYLAFSKCLPLKVIKKLTGIPDDIIQEMVYVGLLKINIDGFYGFYHQQIELYYKNHYQYTELSEDELKMYIDITMREYDRELYLETIFLAQFELNQVQSNIFHKVINNIIIQKLDYCRSYDICKAVSILLSNGVFKVPQKTYISLYEKMTNICISRVGLLMTEKIYEYFYNDFSGQYMQFSNVLSKAMHIIQAYIRGILNLHKPNESLQKSNYILEIVKQHFQDDENYTKLLIELYYLQIYAYNFLSNIKKSLRIIDLCIDLSQKIDEKKYLIQSWFTKGDIYYTYKLSYSNKDQIIKCWDTAWEIYQHAIKETPTFYIDLAFYLDLLIRKTLVMIFTDDRNNAYEKAEELASYFDKCKMMYFEIKIRQLYIVIHLYFSKFKIINEFDYTKLESLLKKCVDICAVYGNETLYLDCFHLLAILQRYYGNQKFSQDNYQKCFSIIQRILDHQISLEHWSYFLFDMVIAIRKNNEESIMPPHIWNLIAKDHELSQQLHQLATIKKTLLENYLNDQIPISVPYDPETHTYFPKI